MPASRERESTPQPATKPASTTSQTPNRHGRIAQIGDEEDRSQQQQQQQQGREQRIATLRAELKTWEKTFSSAHDGRKPAREDIKRDAAVGE